jgi:hypothetical protein
MHAKTAMRRFRREDSSTRANFPKSVRTSAPFLCVFIGKKSKMSARRHFSVRTESIAAAALFGLRLAINLYFSQNFMIAE